MSILFGRLLSIILFSMLLLADATVIFAQPAEDVLNLVGDTQEHKKKSENC